MANKKLPRIFICIDNGMIWESAGDIEVMLVIKNVDKNWIRRLHVQQNILAVDNEEELIHLLEKENYKPEDLIIEEKKHIKVIKIVKKKK